jgi:hypothetical protein
MTGDFIFEIFAAATIAQPVAISFARVHDAPKRHARKPPQRAWNFKA